MDDMQKLMLEVWDLKKQKPKLVITVSGGELEDSNTTKDINKLLVEKIKEGLIKAVKITGTYVFYHL